MTMKTINYKNCDYDLCDSFWDLSLGQFIELYQLWTDKDMVHMDGSLAESFFFKKALIVTNIPEHKLNDADWTEWEQIKLVTADVTFETRKPQPKKIYPDRHAEINKEKVIVELLGRKYSFQPEYGYHKLSTARHIEDLLGDKDMIAHFHYLAALSFWELDEQGNEKPIVIEAIDAKAEMFLQIPLKDIYDHLFFCTIPAKPYTLFMKRFGKMIPETRQLMERVIAAGQMAEFKKYIPSGVGSELGKNSKRTKSSASRSKSKMKQ